MLISLLLTFLHIWILKGNHWLKYSWQGWKSRMAENQFSHGATTDLLPLGVTTTLFGNI